MFFGLSLIRALDCGQKADAHMGTYGMPPMLDLSLAPTDSQMMASDLQPEMAAAGAMFCSSLAAHGY